MREVVGTAGGATVLVERMVVVAVVGRVIVAIMESVLVASENCGCCCSAQSCGI